MNDIPYISEVVAWLHEMQTRDKTWDNDPGIVSYKGKFPYEPEHVSDINIVQGSTSEEYIILLAKVRNNCIKFALFTYHICNRVS